MRIKTNEYIIFTWSHKGSSGYPPQREIRKIMRGRDGIYSLSYAVKETAYSKVIYDEWLDIIHNSKLKPITTI